VQKRSGFKMFLPDFNLVLEELLQLTLTVASLKHLAGLVAEERQQQLISDEPEDVIHPHRLPGESESTNRAPIEAEHETDAEDQDSTAESENERNSSTTSQEKNAMEDVESPEASSIIVETIEGPPPSPPGVENIEAGTSMAAHKLADTEQESEEAKFLVSLASHFVHPVEFVETGLTTSMVAHQIYLTERNEELVPSPKSELKEEPITTFEEDLRENLKEWFKNIDFTATYRNLEEDVPEIISSEDLGGNVSPMVAIIEEEVVKVEEEARADSPLSKPEDFETSMIAHKLPDQESESEFLHLPFSLASHLVLPPEFSEPGLLTSMLAHQQINQAGLSHLEEKRPDEQPCYSVPISPHLEEKECNFEENLRENLKEQLMGLDFKATYCKIEEEEMPEYSKDYEIPIGSNEVEAEVEEVEQNEKETVSEFQSFPATLVSHFVLPVEWSEQTGFTSMVAHHHHHHHHQPCQESSEAEIIPLPNLDHTPIIPKAFEDDLRENIKELFSSIDFKATYTTTEDDLPEDSRENILLMDGEAPVQVPSNEELPKAEEAERGFEENRETSMAAHKLQEMDSELEFVSLPASLASHMVLPMEWPETSLFTSMVSHHHIETMSSLKESQRVGKVDEVEENGNTLDGYLRNNLRDHLQGINFKATYSCLREESQDTIFSEDSREAPGTHEVDLMAANPAEDEKKQLEDCQKDANLSEPCFSESGHCPSLDVSRPGGQLEPIPETEEQERETGNRRAEERKKGKAETDPRSIDTQTALSYSAHQESPVGNNSDHEKDSFENFINESKQTYHERVADEYKSTIKRIQDLQKLVEEEIGEFEKSKKDIKKSEVITVMSNVKGVSFPLEITINQKDQAEESPLVVKEAEKCPKGTQEQFQEEEESESEEVEGDGANIISASCTLMENTPILITTNRDQVECDSGFEGSPDLQKNDYGRESKIDRDGESPVSFPKQTLTSPKRSSEEKKTREKQLLESFFKTENHGQGQIEDATRVTSNPAKRVTPEKKRAPGIPAGIPSRIAQEPKEAKKEKNRKPKVTTAEFKDSIMKKTYKIRFHVNLKESHDEKPRSVLQTFLSFFKDHSVFGKK